MLPADIEARRAEFEAMTPVDLLTWASGRFGEGLVCLSALGAEVRVLAADAPALVGHHVDPSGFASGRSATSCPICNSPNMTSMSTRLCLISR